jgi:hypothetical protein
MGWIYPWAVSKIEVKFMNQSETFISDHETNCMLWISIDEQARKNKKKKQEAIT